MARGRRIAVGYSLPLHQKEMHLQSVIDAQFRPHHSRGAVPAASEILDLFLDCGRRHCSYGRCALYPGQAAREEVQA